VWRGEETRQWLRDTVRFRGLDRTRENPIILKTVLRDNLCRLVFIVVLLSSLLAAGSAPQQTTPPSAQEPSSAQAPRSSEETPSNQAPPTSQPPPTSQVAPSTQLPQGREQDKSNSQDKSSNPDSLKKQEQTGTSNDRLFYALPNFLTLETKNVPPLTPEQKLKVVTRGCFDFIQIPWYGLLAGISQAENSEAGYGQGAAGYGKRYAAYFADGTIENYFTQAFMPILLRQDPRYYTMGRGGFTRRTSYAVSRIFVTRSDSGERQVNYSEIFGSGIASAISTYSYHPREDRNVSNTAKVWGTQVGYDTLTNVIKEYWPDIRRKLGKKNKRK